MAKLHSQLTGNDLHNPKGFEVETNVPVFTISQSTSILSSSVDIVPDTDITLRNLGSPSNPWGALYVSTGSIFFTDPDSNQTLQRIKANGSGFDFGNAAITASTIVSDTGQAFAPAGTISSSAQVKENLPIGTVSSSAQLSADFLDEVGDSVISSSLQIATEISGAFDVVSASLSSDIDSLENDLLSISSSIVTDLSSVSSSIESDLATIDGRVDTLEGKTLVSSSTQIDNLGFLQVSGDSIVSSSAQVSDFNIFLEKTTDSVISSSVQVDVTSTTNYSSVVQTTGNQSVGGIKTFTANNIFNGLQTFEDINVNGTASFAVIQSVTGSAKIIGDAFIVLNNNTPTERYAGVAVYDSGSAGVSASFQFDGESNDWFYEYSDDGGSTNEYGVTLFGPEYNTKGSPTYLTSGSIPKGDGGHHLYDSNISDDGTLITLGSNTSVTGTLVATGTTLISSSAQIATDVSGAFTAGTGLDLSSGEFSVDVSDFMTNGVDNRVLTATGADAMNAESGLTYDGSALAVTGNITATGEITAYASDDRLKTKIGLIEGAVEKLSHLNGFYYEWNDTAKSLGLDDEERKVGLSAQEMNDVLPEVVRKSTVGEDYLTIQYDKVVALLVEGMKEQQQHINQLTARIDELENRGE